MDRFCAYLPHVYELGAYIIIDTILGRKGCINFKIYANSARSMILLLFEEKDYSKV